MNLKIWKKADKALSGFISSTKVFSKTLNPLGIVWGVSEHTFYISWSQVVEQEGLLGVEGNKNYNYKEGREGGEEKGGKEELWL